MNQSEKAATLRKAVDIVNEWLNKHKFDYRHERNKKVLWQIEEWAENLERLGEIEEPIKDFADCPDSMDCCDI